MFLLAVLVCLTGCSAGTGMQKDDPSVTRDLFAMDTYMTLTAYGEQAEEAIDAAETEIRYLDALLSTGDPDSEISVLNHAGSGEVSDVSMYLLDRSLEVHSMTGGAFNPLIYPLMDAWGFTDKDFRVPDDGTIKKLLPILDTDGIIIDKEADMILFDKPGMMIDLGGIAKGYTSSRIMEIFSEHGVSSGLVSLGGNVQVLGKKQNGDPWRIAIRDPEKEDKYLGVLHLTDTAAITSGGYERYFEENGKTYHHIIDPKTGYPAENGLTSVTVVTPDGTLADMLSTSLFILGTDRAIRYCEDHKGEFDAILFTDGRKMYATAGLREILQPTGSVTWIAD